MVAKKLVTIIEQTAPAVIMALFIFSPASLLSPLFLTILLPILAAIEFGFLFVKLISGENAQDIISLLATAAMIGSMVAFYFIGSLSLLAMLLFSVAAVAITALQLFEFLNSFSNKGKFQVGATLISGLDAASSLTAMTSLLIFFFLPHLAITAAIVFFSAMVTKVFFQVAALFYEENGKAELSSEIMPPKLLEATFNSAPPSEQGTILPSQNSSLTVLQETKKAEEDFKIENKEAKTTDSQGEARISLLVNISTPPNQEGLNPPTDPAIVQESDSALRIDEKRGNQDKENLSSSAPISTPKLEAQPTPIVSSTTILVKSMESSGVLSKQIKPEEKRESLKDNKDQDEFYEVSNDEVNKIKEEKIEILESKSEQHERYTGPKVTEACEGYLKELGFSWRYDMERYALPNSDMVKEEPDTVRITPLSFYHNEINKRWVCLTKPVIDREKCELQKNLSLNVMLREISAEMMLHEAKYKLKEKDSSTKKIEQPSYYFDDLFIPIKEINPSVICFPFTNIPLYTIKEARDHWVLLHVKYNKELGKHEAHLYDSKSRVGSGNYSLTYIEDQVRNHLGIALNIHYVASQEVLDDKNCGPFLVEAFAALLKGEELISWANMWRTITPKTIVNHNNLIKSKPNRTAPSLDSITDDRLFFEVSLLENIWQECVKHYGKFPYTAEEFALFEKIKTKSDIKVEAIDQKISAVDAVQRYYPALTYDANGKEIDNREKNYANAVSAFYEEFRSMQEAGNNIGEKKEHLVNMITILTNIRGIQSIYGRCIREINKCEGSKRNSEEFQNIFKDFVYSINDAYKKLKVCLGRIVVTPLPHQKNTVDSPDEKNIPKGPQ